MLDHEAYPHIIDLVIHLADYDTQLALRRTSAHYRDVVDAIIFAHVRVAWIATPHPYYATVDGRRLPLVKTTRALEHTEIVDHQLNITPTAPETFPNARVVRGHRGTLEDWPATRVECVWYIKGFMGDDDWEANTAFGDALAKSLTRVRDGGRKLVLNIVFDGSVVPGLLRRPRAETPEGEEGDFYEYESSYDGGDGDGDDNDDGDDDDDDDDGEPPEEAEAVEETNVEETTVTDADDADTADTASDTASDTPLAVVFHDRTGADPKVSTADTVGFLMTLIGFAWEQHVTYVYRPSPGLDAGIAQFVAMLEEQLAETDMVLSDAASFVTFDEYRESAGDDFTLETYFPDGPQI